MFRWTIVLIVLTTATQALTGCLYRKVHLTKTEKNLIPYWARKSSEIFRNENLQDTVRLYNNSGYRFTPNFDHWWTKKLQGDTSKLRGLYYSVAAHSNFPHNKYTDKNLHLYLTVSFTKRWDTDTLRLKMHDFPQTFNLHTNKSDTLVFERPKEEHCNKCLTRILWTSDRGIVQIEKSDGTVWRILTRDK
jgi:hypothetical protein